MASQFEHVRNTVAMEWGRQRGNKWRVGARFATGDESNAADRELVARLTLVIEDAATLDTDERAHRPAAPGSRKRVALSRATKADRSRPDAITHSERWLTAVAEEWVDSARYSVALERHFRDYGTIRDYSTERLSGPRGRTPDIAAHHLVYGWRRTFDDVTSRAAPAPTLPQGFSRWVFCAAVLTALAARTPSISCVRSLGTGAGPRPR